MNTEQAKQTVAEYIQKCDYTYTVDDIVQEFAKFLSGSYVSFTTKDTITHCRNALDILAAKALRAQQERKNPLTLEELKERVGRPVYLVLDNDECNYTGWALMVETTETMGGKCWYLECVDTGRCLNIDECGKTWTTYEHEPKEAR